MNCNLVTILQGDALQMLRTLPDESVQCVVTSPPYWGLRDYGVEGQIGLEKTPQEYIAKMVAVFSEIRRVLKRDGTAWVNIGDSYAGSGKGTGDTGNNKGDTASRGVKTGGVPGITVNTCGARPPLGFKAKDLIGIPWRLAFALQESGWYLRSDIIWAKPNCMPESVTDRPTRSHEYIFLLSKNERYFYDCEAIKEPCSESTIERVSQPNYENQLGSERANGGAKTNGNMKAVVSKQRGHSRRHDGFNDRWDKMERTEQCSGMRNKRDVWTVAPENYGEAHFATFPPDLIKPCILAGSRSRDVVLDPFGGSGTTGQVALELGRRTVLIELNPDYIPLIHARTNVTPGLHLGCHGDL